MKMKNNPGLGLSKKVQLPLLFGYSDEPIANTEKNTRDGYRLCKQPWYETSD